MTLFKMIAKANCIIIVFLRMVTIIINFIIEAEDMLLNGRGWIQPEVMAVFQGNKITRKIKMVMFSRS